MSAISSKSARHIRRETRLGVNTNVSELIGEFALPKWLNSQMLVLVLKGAIAFTVALTRVLVGATPK